ncbi:MAG TPA: DUF418 domain-containing protein [Sphingomicrobium sp.]|nr:DUF418 domain-containing protein [Sphingomicrobium sp.]
MAGISRDRIVTLDIIRGIAVMGIFSVNVVAFAMIDGAYFNPAAYGGHSGVDLALWMTNMVVVDGKLRSLFSMLFGASMLLVAERAEAAGESAWSLHARRMLVLFLIGLAHFYLLWWGDILHLYAAVGLAAFLFRYRSAGELFAWALLFMLADVALFGAIVAGIHQLDVAAHAHGAAADVIRRWNDIAQGFYPSAAQLAADQAIYGGSYLTRLQEMLTDRLAEPLEDIRLLGAETLALMLFGMWGYKSGFLTGTWPDRGYARVALITIPLGAVVFAAIVAVDIRSGFYLPYVFGGLSAASAPFRPVMAFGYAALIILATRRGGWLAERLAAVGRTAFTNYLGTSLVAAFVFYGWGLGLYGQVSRAEAWLLVPAVWLAMLLWSKPWLDRFNYGPLEWLWRSLARWEMQRMRKGAAPAAATG